MSKLKTPLEEYLDNADNRARMHLVLTAAQLISVASITIGLVVFLLWLVGIINL